MLILCTVLVYAALMLLISNTAFAAEVCKDCCYISGTPDGQDQYGPRISASVVRCR